MPELKVTMDGLEKLNAELDRRFSGLAWQRIVDKALREGGRVIKMELLKEFVKFKDTGASMDEMIISKPMTLNGVRTVIIYWSGPKARHAIVHLNEFGTIKNPNPRGKGAVERALRAGQQKYFEVVTQQIRRAMA